MVTALPGRFLVHAVLATVFLILPPSALAQQVGVKAGANFASLTPEEDEARYTHGLRHINTDDNGEGDRIKNRVFSVTVGFRLR